MTPYDPSRRYRPPRLEPTEEQVAIQMAEAEAIVVHANAGAAKTTTLALRVAQAFEYGLAPEQLLVLTYTAPACEAVQAALRRIGLPEAVVRRVPVHSFDGFAAGVLRGVERGSVRYLETPEAVAPFVRQALQGVGLADDSASVERFLAEARRLKGTLQFDRARWEGEVVSDDLAETLGVEPPLLRAWLRYESVRQPRLDGVDRPAFRHVFDATYDLAWLLDEPEPSTPLDEVAGWPRRLAGVLVDEMHDLNEAMAVILRRLLATNHAGFFGVGDVDQVIHGAAGAEAGYLLGSWSLGRHTLRRFPLTASHRFGGALAKVAGRVADKPYTTLAAHATAVECLLHPAEDDRGAADLLVETVLAWKSAARGDLSRSAILLRHACQSVAVENALLEAGLSYDTRGFRSYVLQPEVLLIRALLAVATRDFAQLQAPETLAATVRALVFFCGIELGHEESERETQDERLESALRHLVGNAGALPAFLEHQVIARAEPALGERMRRAIASAQTVAGGAAWFDAFLDTLGLPRWVERVFIERQRRADSLAYLDGLREAARQRGVKAFFDSLATREAAPAVTPSPHKRAIRAAQDRKSRLTLACIPDVKGLEFDHVLIPELARGVFPSELAADAREERNLFYVAVTRARQRLTLLAPRAAPSEFLQAVRAPAD